MFHNNRFRFDLNRWLRNLFTEFDEEFYFSVGGQGKRVSHLKIRVVFNFDLFVVAVKVDDAEFSDLGNFHLVDELKTLVVEIFVSLNGWDSLEGGVFVDSKAQLDVQIDNLRLIHGLFDRSRQ